MSHTAPQKVDYTVEAIVLDGRSHGVSARKLGATLCGIELTLEEVRDVSRSGSSGYAQASTLTCPQCRKSAESGNS